MSYNNGNDLHYTSLQDIPSKAGQPINYHEITMGPRFTSFHPQFSAPASRNYALASGTAHFYHHLMMLKILEEVNIV